MPYDEGSGQLLTTTGWINSAKATMNGLTQQTHISHRRFSRRPSTSASFAILVVASLFALVMTGCGSKSSTGTSATTGASGTSATTATSAAPTPDASKLVQESAKTTQTLRSVHIALTATNLPKLPVSSVNGDVTSQQQGNGQAVGDAKFRATPDAPFVDTQFLVTDKVFYTKGADGKYNSVGPSQKIYDPAVILDKDKGLANVIKNVQNPKVDGKETIDGVATVKVSGTIDANVIDPVIPTLGQGGGTLPITLWIADVALAATPTSIPSDQPSPGTGPNLVRMMVNKDQGSVEVTLSNWAKPVTIPSPTG
jgi:LppX_LprAFG lipoprotein